MTIPCTYLKRARQGSVPRSEESYPTLLEADSQEGGDDMDHLHD